MSEWKKTGCNMCAQCCGLEMEVENNEIINVRPDPDNPRSKGYCCRKARAAKYYQKHADRLNYPLKRVGNDYVRIPWEQALSEIAEKLKSIVGEHGPRSLALVGCTLSSAQEQAPLAQTVLKMLGSQYYYNPTGLEFMGIFWTFGRILGKQYHFAQPDEEHTDTFILWGCNAYVSHQMAHARPTLREFSGDPSRNLIVVDPRLSETARLADMHVMLRPGSDALLIRAMIALILKEGWQDQAYIDKWIGDMEQIKPWFENVDIEECCRVCGVSFEQVRELCVLMTTTKFVIHQDLGIYMGRHNTASSFLLIILHAICGSLLVPGGLIVHDNFLQLGPHTDERDPNVWRGTATNRFPVQGTYPTGILSNEIMSGRDDRLRAVLVSMSNPLRSFQDSDKLTDAFDNLDLLVCIDSCMTETARHAHYILPGMSGYEADEFCLFQFTYPEMYFQIKPPVVMPVGDRKADSEIWVELADALGLIPPIPDSLYDAAENKTRMEYLGELMAFIQANPSYMPALMMVVAKTLGKAMGSIPRSILWAAVMTSEALPALAVRAGFMPTPTILDDVYQAILDHPEGVLIGVGDPEEQFNYITHPDKKLHLYAEEIERYLERITPEKEAAALVCSKEFPFALSAGSHFDTGVNSVMRNPATNQHRNFCKVSINPMDAEMLGIEDGQLVKVTTKAGSVEICADCTYKTGKGYVVIPHHFGFEFGGKTYGVGVNKLTSAEDMDEITGNPMFRYVPCRIEAI